jgi:hypothetical protein
MCDANQAIEMHHVRSIKGLREKKNDFYTRQMEAINRKQIPLCRDHHQRLHLDTWTDEEKRDYPKLIKTFSKKKNINDEKLEKKEERKA